MSPPSLRVLVVEDRAEDAELSVRELQRAELDCETRRVDTAEAVRRVVTSLAAVEVLEDEMGVGVGGFGALVEESWDGVALLAADGTIVYGSPATSRLLGYDLAEFVGHNAMEFIHSDDRAAVLLRLEEVTARPPSRLHAAARVRHKNGTWRPLEGAWTNPLADRSAAAI